MRIENIKDQDSHIKKFFSSSFPHSINSLCFVWYNQVHRYDLDSYFPCLQPCLSRIKYEFCTNYPSMSSSTFSSLIQGCKHLKRLIIKEAKIDVSGTLDFGSNLDYKLEYISFAYCGDVSYSNWKEKPSEFKKILESFPLTGLDKSLKTLDIYGCHLKNESIHSILDSLNLSHITVVKESPNPFEF